MAYHNHDVYTAIADANRRQILSMLAGKEMSVNGIASHFNMTRPAVSKHLRVLEKTDLVRVRQSGRERIYSLHPDPLREVADWIAEYGRFWEDRLTRLKNQIESANARH